MGQSLADAIGIKEAPMMDVDTSAKLVLEQVCHYSPLVGERVARLEHSALNSRISPHGQIDKLSIETSGKFIMFNGREMPW